MPSDYDALLAGVLAAPEDDAPRLILADWLDENGEPERAEFIRVQCELARPPKTGLDRNAPVGLYGERERRFLKWGKSRKALLCRERELLLLSPHGRVFPTRPELGERCNLWHWMGAAYWLIPEGEVYDRHVVFRRGFIHSITCTAADWLQHADSIVSQHPVREVRLTTWPDTHWTIANAPSSQLGLFSGHDFILGTLSYRWPGVTFHLPQREVPPSLDGLLAGYASGIITANEVRDFLAGRH